MNHTMRLNFRHGEAEVIVEQGNGDWVTYLIRKWYDGVYSVEIDYHGEFCGIHLEYQHRRLDGKQVRALLLERLGESALEIPTYLRRQPTFAA
jgi:hypothetical protein